MGFAIGLILGVLAGVFGTALCVSGKSKNIFTNADRLSLDASRLAELMYNSDNYNEIGCPARLDEQFDELVGCRYPDEERGCVKCIKEWLNREVDVG